MPKSRSRSPFSWKQEYGGLPVWAIAAGVALIGVLFAVPAVVSATATPSAPYVRPSDAFEDPAPTSEAVRAVFVGDSYTYGTGASSESTRWTTLAAEQAGWVEVNLGRGGTGYVTTSDVNGCGLAYCPNYQEMVSEVVAENPDVVVVAGGQNDFDEWMADPEAVTAAVAATLTGIRDGLPDARIIVVGPSTPGNVTDLVTGFAASVEEQAGLVGATFVSLTNPPVLVPEMVGSDGAHVNDSGHQAIADRVVAGL